MTDLDNALQSKLNQLENGDALDDVIAGLGEEELELASLLRMVAAVKEVPQPVPAAQNSQVRKTRLLQESEVLRMNKKSTATNVQGKLSDYLIPAFAFSFLIILFMSLAVAGAGLWLYGSQSGRAATMANISGQVEMAASAPSNDWKALGAGDKVPSGSYVRTQGSSSAIMAFADGSQMVLSPNTQVKLVEATQERNGIVKVVIAQQYGTTSHKVIPMREKQSSYVVRTPSGQAFVKGTTFDVSVAQTGVSRFAVNAGSVLVSASNQDVILKAGQTTSTTPGTAPDIPGYQFSLQGTVEAQEENTWLISGISIGILDTTNIFGNPQVGDQVYVDGRVLDGGAWVADLIVPVDGDPISSFTGTVDSIDGENWVVNGHAIYVGEDALVDEGIEVGHRVRVLFTISDGIWVALSITSLEDDPEPDPDPSPTPDPSANPSLSFEPDEIEVYVCEPLLVAATGTLVNTAEGEDDLAEDVQLAYEVIAGASYASAVGLNPDFWTVIAPGESENFEVITQLTEEWASAPAGTEVKIRVTIASENNRPGGHPGRLTVTLVNNCGEEPTPTPTTDPDPTVTPTETPEPTATPDPGEEPICTGANPHPVGMKLAQRYGVTYEEIMGWFCMGFGFGEIDLAYGLSVQTGVPVEEIFQMKMDGMGWGNIKKELNSLPGNGNSSGNPNRGNSNKDKPDKAKPPKPNKP